MPQWIQSHRRPWKFVQIRSKHLPLSIHDKLICRFTLEQTRGTRNPEFPRRTPSGESHRHIESLNTTSQEEIWRRNSRIQLLESNTARTPPPERSLTARRNCLEMDLARRDETRWLIPKGQEWLLISQHLSFTRSTDHCRSPWDRFTLLQRISNIWSPSSCTSYFNTWLDLS